MSPVVSPFQILPYLNPVKVQITQNVSESVCMLFVSTVGPVVFHHLIHLQTESFPDFLQMCTSLRFLAAQYCDIFSPCSAVILLTNMNLHFCSVICGFSHQQMLFKAVDCCPLCNLTVYLPLLKCYPLTRICQEQLTFTPFY